jgi:hypothetical protein
MTRSTYEIAKEIAQEAVSIAHCAGYEVKPERDLFFYSDVSNLADDIAYWLERHMRPEEAVDGGEVGNTAPACLPAPR